MEVIPTKDGTLDRYLEYCHFQAGLTFQACFRCWSMLEASHYQSQTFTEQDLHQLTRVGCYGPLISHRSLETLGWNEKTH